MVDLHQPLRPNLIVVKPAPRHRRPRQHPATCIVCGAVLRSDHSDELVCDAHQHCGFNPRSVPPCELDERICLLLLRARGRPVVLCRALGCDENDSNRSAIRDAVRRLNATGFMHVVSCQRGGRKLAQQWRVVRRKVGA